MLFVLVALYVLFIKGIGGILVSLLNILLITMVPLIKPNIQSIAPPLQRTWNATWTKILARIALLAIGFYLIHSENVSVRRG